MISTVGVLGAGQMGSGIAHLFAQYGYEVLLYDIAQSQLEKATGTIRKNLERQVKTGTVTQDQVPDTLSRIRTIQCIDELSHVQLAVEAISENESVKLDVFRKIDTIVNPKAILATNTSSISITKIASVTNRPGNVIGMHFMNPVQVMKLVEIIRGHATSDETYSIIAQLVTKLGKETAVSQDSPGFIVNRILIPMINEAIFALYEGVASVEDIDKGMKLGTNQPMGPLSLADYIGLDTLLAITNVLYDGFKESKYRPCPLLIKMVNAGNIGKKVGRGFHKYE